jgi:lipopolysaccharide transport system ATP-binding protein
VHIRFAGWKESSPISSDDMTSFAIRAEGLGKLYKIGGPVERYQTLRDVVVRKLTARLRFRRRRSAGPEESTELWALRDVSFEIRPGEVVGVIGRNGAGKSTLLKILSRITPPTTGSAEIRGRVGSLLEVGTGFHQELTGRENVFLNGAILGMRRAEIQRHFDAIVSFAEVERFIDTPVKHYSTGMYLRLAFAVAAHLQTEILLVDEVLAVGDAAFQKKCLGKMGEAAQAGRTVLFVSHNMGAVTGLCQRGIWIDGGRIREDGDVDDVTQKYLTLLSAGTFVNVSRHADFAIRSVVLRGGSSTPGQPLRPGDDLVVEIEYEAQKALERPSVILVVQSMKGSCFAANMLLDGGQPPALVGTGRLRCRFRRLPLLPQNYTVQLAIRSRTREPIVDMQDVGGFSVAGDLAPCGFDGDYRTLASKSIPVMIPYEWVWPDGTVREVSLVRPAEVTETVGAGERTPEASS